MAQLSDSDIRPTVLHPIELASFIQYTLMRTNRDFRLIICSSQDEFLHQLLASVQHEKDVARLEAEASDFDPQSVERMLSRPHDLLIPTLHQLASSSSIQVTFCSTLPQLQAYLSTYSLGLQESTHSSSSEGNNRPAAIALINPIALHRNVASFSAQGLSRTFASAIEAAARSQAKLLVVECPNRAPSLATVGDGGSDDDMQEPGQDGAEPDRSVNEQQDPWEEQISLLNVTTKTFGVGDQGWVGRTVRVRTVVERWCTFVRPET